MSAGEASQHPGSATSLRTPKMCSELLHKSRELKCQVTNVCYLVPGARGNRSVVSIPIKILKQEQHKHSHVFFSQQYGCMEEHKARPDGDEQVLVTKADLSRPRKSPEFGSFSLSASCPGLALRPPVGSPEVEILKLISLGLTIGLRPADKAQLGFRFQTGAQVLKRIKK